MRRHSFLRLGAAGTASAVSGASGLLTWTPRARAATVSKTFYITDGYIA